MGGDMKMEWSNEKRRKEKKEKRTPFFSFVLCYELRVKRKE
jgi:hypothetical protein